MTELRRNVAKRVVDKWNQRVRSGQLDRYFEFYGTPKAMLSVDGNASNGNEWDENAYNALPSGAEYVGPDGRKRRKR